MAESKFVLSHTKGNKVDFIFEGEQKMPLSKKTLDLLDEYDDATRAWATAEPRGYKPTGLSDTDRPKLTAEQQTAFAAYFDMRKKFIMFLSQMETEIAHHEEIKTTG